jgi:hypothetical protein
MKANLFEPVLHVCEEQAVANVSRVLKQGGQVLVRDYGKGDWAEQRFSDARRLRKLGENYYVRGDGTRAFYFSKAGPSTGRVLSITGVYEHSACFA